MNKRDYDIPNKMIIAGGVIFLVGQTWATFDKRKRNTTSEMWRDSPQPLKYAIVGALLAVVAHWVWPMPSTDAPDIVIEELNLDVHA